MQGDYSYADIALDDLRASKELLNLQMYNHSTRLCQQYVEKMFKEVLVHLGTSEKDMYSLSIHNIYKLSLRISDLTKTKFTKDDVGFFRGLTDFYFDTNYPSENYVRIQSDEANDVYISTVLFADRLQPILSENIKDSATLYANHRTFIEAEKARLTSMSPDIAQKHEISIVPDLLHISKDIPGYVLVRGSSTNETKTQQRSDGYFLVKYDKVDIKSWKCDNMDNGAIVVPNEMTMFFMSGLETFIAGTEMNPVSWQDGTLHKELISESNSYKAFCIELFSGTPIEAEVIANVEKSHAANLESLNNHMQNVLSMVRNPESLDTTNTKPLETTDTKNVITEPPSR